MTHPVLDENETDRGLSMDAEAFVSVPLENNDSEMFSEALSEASAQLSLFKIYEYNMI
jgi:hypothetical protein